jgi:hypothetical protein
MELIIMIAIAFPIGFFIKNRTVAYLSYIAVHSFVFIFQSVDLITEWAGGSKSAFGPYPKASELQVWSYGLVNLLIFGAGLGLVALGHYVASRRRRKSVALNLDSVHS